MSDEPKDDAETTLAGVLDRLVAATTLSRPQADAVDHEFRIAHRPSSAVARESATRSSALIEVGGYLGAAFVVGAIGALIGPNWDDLSRSVELSLLIGPGLLLAICAVVLAAAMPGSWSIHPGDQAGPRRRLVGALVLAAGGLLAGAAGVFFDNHVDQAVPLTLLAVWGLGYLLCRGHVLHLAGAGALIWSILALLDESFDDNWRRTGLVLFATGVGWAALVLIRRVRLIDERDLGLVVAGVMAFSGAEFVTATDPAIFGFLLLAAISATGLAGYLHSRQLPALAVGGLTLAVAVPQAVIHYTDGSLGAAGALLVCGLSIVTASAVALRLSRSNYAPLAG
jgi:hypothetical protein